MKTLLGFLIALAGVIALLLLLYKPTNKEVMNTLRCYDHSDIKACCELGLEARPWIKERYKGSEESLKKMGCL